MTAWTPLQEYTFHSRYSHYRPDLGRRETWEEAIDRLLDMHRAKLGPKVEPLLQEVRPALVEQLVLPSMRSLQWGGPAALQHEIRNYNCAFSHIDRPRVFAEFTYVGLCGCGPGFSVQKQHVAKLPKLAYPGAGSFTFVVPDSIEGWAEAVNRLVGSYVPHGGQSQPRVAFDLCNIRKAGAPVAGGIGIAPGPEVLRDMLADLRTQLDGIVRRGGTIRPIDAFDMLMRISDAIVSGGVRRVATIALFTPDDEDMCNAKVGDWWKTHPYRRNANITAVYLRGSITEEQFRANAERAKQWGEPGILLVDDLDIGVNPCAEILMDPTIIRRVPPHAAPTERQYRIIESGWSFCNLTEINGAKCRDSLDLRRAARAAAILGTIQATYTDVGYLTDASREIMQRDALLGVSITGWADMPYGLFTNRRAFRGAARTVLDTNTEVAALLGINEAARATCVKPSGTSSLLLACAYGISRWYARAFLRRIRANKSHPVTAAFCKANPFAVERDAMRPNDPDAVVLSFPMFAAHAQEVGETWRDVLRDVRYAMESWVKPGGRSDRATKTGLVAHNVSNTLTVPIGEWDEAVNEIWDAREDLTAVSLLSATGELDYTQAPHVEVLSLAELEKRHGAHTVLAASAVFLKADDEAEVWDLARNIAENPESPEATAEFGQTPQEAANLVKRIAIAAASSIILAKQQPVDYSTAGGPVDLGSACEGVRCLV